MTHSDELSMLTQDPYSKAVAAYTELINNCDALTFLMGAGCSKSAGLPLTGELTDLVLSSCELDRDSKSILQEIASIFSNNNDSHIEHYLSELVDLLTIAERRSDLRVKEDDILIRHKRYDARKLRNASNQIKRGIAQVINKKVNITNHRSFVSAIHTPMRAGRPISSQPVEYLVLNYDTIIEDALASESIRYADGLFGGSTAWWDTRTFDTDGLRARVIKLHGSIDWRLFQDEQSPRRVGLNIDTSDETTLPVLIWPSSTKYQETQLDPFAQLLERAREAMKSPVGAQRLLTICGYSFGDNHINMEIDKALRESGGRLTIAAFTNENQPVGQLRDWHNDSRIREQVLIFANRGFYHTSNLISCKHDVTWWKFENLTAILRGEI